MGQKRIHLRIIILPSDLTARFDSGIAPTRAISESMPMMAARCWRRFAKEEMAASGTIK